MRYISTFDNMKPLDDLAERHGDMCGNEITYSDLVDEGYRVVEFAEMLEEE